MALCNMLAGGIVAFEGEKKCLVHLRAAQIRIATVHMGQSRICLALLWATSECGSAGH